MGYAGRRPMGRLFYWALVLITIASGYRLAAFGAAPDNGAATTIITDTVYMADGSPASGTLIITWPAFVTASGTAVAPGNTSVVVGANGALSVALVPNAGATPAGVYYSVVYQLGAGQVRTEYWIVPTTSPANLAKVRTTPGSGLAAQPVSMQYVNSALASKADDGSVVHLNGQETIGGVKTFASAPNVPTPTGDGQVANKSYVDSAVSNVGAGNYLSTAGGTMSGPIVLSGNPSAPMQAAPKGYVDAAFSGKADLLGGIVPASELGSGTANAGTCLLGNGTWGACATGGGSGNVSTTPAANQDVVQPAGTRFSTNNLANARYVTASWNWLQSPTDDLTTAGSKTIHLSPCPLGIDTSNNSSAQYAVYISGTGTAEAAPVTGGNCTPGNSSGTITVATAYSHAAGYAVGSASSGIQEAINDSGSQHGTIMLLPASGTTPNYNVYSTVFLNTRKSLLSGYGAMVQCFTRTACLIDGNYLGGGQYSTIAGIEFIPGLNIDGVQIASVAASNGTYTITTATNHPFVTGDYIILYYSNPSQTQEGRYKITVTGSNQFTYTLGATTFAAATSYGWAAIENTAIEDIADHVTVRDIKIGSAPSNNLYFHWGIVIGNDQSFKLDGLTNEGSGAVIRCTQNFCGALVYARGDQGAAPVVNIDHLESSMQCGGNGIRYASGNTLHVMNSVVQGFSQYGIYYAGGLQNVMIGGTYQESSGSCNNPAYPVPLGANAGIITNDDLTYIGDDPIGGQFPSFPAANTGSQQNNYYVVIRSSARGVMGMLYIGSCSTSGSGNCTTYWPEPDLSGLGTVTYDELRTVGASAIPPNGTGSYAIATGLSGNCSTAGICTNIDPQTGTSNYTVPLPQNPLKLNFWPGAVVLGNASKMHINDCGQASGIIATTYLPAIFCNRSLPGLGGSYTPYWASYREGDSVGNGNPSVGAVLKQTGPASGAPTSGVTGLYGFLNTGLLGQTDMVTLAYSNPFLTLATPGYRPSASAADTAIGFDSAAASSPANAQLAFRAPIAISEYVGSVFDNGGYKERLTANAKTFNVPVTINGNLTVTGTCTGCGGSGGGGGSGTVNNGAGTQLAMYSSSGTAVSGDTLLSDNGTTLNYSGSGGISASSATFGGNVTVGGQLVLTGPWQITTPPAPSMMLGSPNGTSSLAISNDGNFYISANGGSPSKVQTAATDAVPTVFGRSGSVIAQSGDYSVSQVTGAAPTASPTFTGTVTEPVPTLPSQTGNTFFAAPSGSSGAPGFRAITAADVPTLNQNTTGNAASATNLAGGATGSIPYQSGAGATAMLAGNTATADQVLTSTGTGSAAQAPTLKNAPALSAANMTSFPNTVAAVSPAGSLATGDYVKANGFATTTDSGVLAGPYPVPWITSVRGGGSATFAANVVKMWGVMLTYPLLTSSVAYYASTADSSGNMYDIGIACGQANCNGGAYSQGQIILSIGATAGTSFSPSTGTYTKNWTQGTKTLQPGKYYVVLTTNCSSSCATITSGGSSGDITFQNAATAGTTSGGALVGFTAPGDVWSWGANVPALAVK